MSICLHPHTAVNKIVWDRVNFARGSNRRKEDYKRPPAQPAYVTKRAYEHFEEFIRYISSFKNVQWITAREALKIYGRTEKVSLDRSEVGRVAEHFLSSSEHMKCKNGYLSPAEGFYIVSKCLSDYAACSVLPSHINVVEPLGPIVSFKSKGRNEIENRGLTRSLKVCEHPHAISGHDSFESKSRRRCRAKPSRFPTNGL